MLDAINPLNAISQILSVLRTLPFWMLFGLALAGWGILFIPAGIEAVLFRQQWGPYIWAVAVIFSFLTLIHALQKIIESFIAYRKQQLQKRILRLTPLLQKSWWHLAKQQDDSFCTQISIKVQIANTTSQPVRIVKVDLIRPKAQVLQAYVLLPTAGSPYHSDEHAIPAHDTLTASIHVMARGAIAPRGKPICIDISATDQYGIMYKIKNIFLQNHDTPIP